MKPPRHRLRLDLVLLAVQAAAWGQTPDLRQIVERLERLEQENRALKEEVQALRQELRSTAPAPVEERLEIQERRVEEQAQTKVEASQRFPIRITGMALANAFINSKQNGGGDNPAIASLARGVATGGATWRQTTFGLQYDGPRSFANGHVTGSLMLDFFGGTSAPLGSNIRIRTADVSLAWKTRTVSLAQDKPLFAPRDPTSLAQVGLAPLTGAGNLWLWLPQVRFEQRFNFSDRSELRAQLGVMQTSETSANVPAQFTATLERYRPGYQGRFQFARSIGSGRIEIAPGFHTSRTHVAGTSVPSNLFSMDWLVAPVVNRLELTGAFFHGENVAHFGTGGIRQGFTVLGSGNVRAVKSTGGWSQLKIGATDRLSFHLMTGIHDDRNADILNTGIGRNLAAGANFFYRIAPNVIFSFETMQVRTTYLGTGRRLNNHYDLSLAYLW